METEKNRRDTEGARNLNETIVACATPLGTGAIGIVKISGPYSISILDRIFRPRSAQVVSEFENFRLYVGDVIDPTSGQVLDEALAVLMRSPRSYTREDVVEIQCHGGSYPVQRIFSLVIENGAVPAPPGEFTRRAFLNGRIDLTQAEAVAHIVHARSDKALALSHRILAGDLGKLLHRWQGRIASLQATIQAFTDFSDQIVGSCTGEPVLRDLAQFITEIESEIIRSERQKVLQESFRVVIAGKTNVGKSSLFNALIAQDRVIVTEIAGTTRDIVEETLCLGGCMIKFADTAGIRVTGDPIEQLGMQKTETTLEKADLIIAVLDRSQPLTHNDLTLAEMLQGKACLLVLNKADLDKYHCNDNLYTHFNAREIHEISARTGYGVEKLIDAITGIASQSLDGEETSLVATERQRYFLRQTLDALRKTRSVLLEDYPLDMAGFELDEASRGLGRIIGKEFDDKIADTLFSTFCIGK
ncbi:MAG TPA: tRNA uridine-5-carboxymethylaminomethyl(34) synthesis GTPase MnmE [Atribacteraceae bacterium]|nr:tRNA uridine-5-carboxymethylaminomethyl(34) synthesis GTPase MnmE [Atribacteraceae bacterium]